MDFFLMKYLFLFMLLFLSQCSYLGLSKDINAVTHDPKIEALRRQEQELHPFAIVQGLTTEDYTEIKIIAKKNDNLLFKVFHNEDVIKALDLKILPAGATGYVIHRLKISQLKINTNYTLQVVQDNKILDQRNFQTVDLNLTQPKIGIVSCMHDKYQDLQFSMWNDYLKQTPTYTFMIGDNVYADTLLTTDGKKFIFQFATEDMLWKRYIQTFNTLSYYRSSRLIPTLAIWDDHDYGYNNGDESYPNKKASLQVFESFFGSEYKSGHEITKSNKTKIHLEKLVGAGFVFKAFGQNFVFMDNRSFRSEPSKLNKPQETHLGSDQTAKILKSISSSEPVWLIKGDQFFGGYHSFESFENNHPNDFKKFLKDLKAKGAKVFFVSGDRHLNELMKIPNNELGYETFELTSSGIHASVYPDAWKKFPNPKQLHGVSGVHNYSLVQVQNLSPWIMDVSSYGPKMKVLYQEKITINSELKP